MNTLIGKTLQGGKYALEKELGRGGFGITFRATHHYLHQPVVIKTLNESFRFNANFSRLLRQFQDEARRLAVCSHPNIVRISDFFLEAGWPYMVMEYISGEPLSRVVTPESPLDETTAVRCIRQIGEALKVVHQQGLLHRDVKPDNIMLRAGTNEVVLIDFGISREFTPDVTQTHTSIVSDGYAPIEQYLSRAKWTPATDVYGLAATLYWLLTGTKPVSSPLRDREPLSAPRDLYPSLSPAVNQAVMRGMAVESQYRPQSMEEWLSLLPDTREIQTFSESFISSANLTAATVAYSPPEPSSSGPSIPHTRQFGVKPGLAGIVAIIASVAVAMGIALSQLERPSPVPAEQPVSEEPQPEESQVSEPVAPPSESESAPEPTPSRRIVLPRRARGQTPPPVVQPENTQPQPEEATIIPSSPAPPPSSSAPRQAPKPSTGSSPEVVIPSIEPIPLPQIDPVAPPNPEPNPIPPPEEIVIPEANRVEFPPTTKLEKLERQRNRDTGGN